MPALTFSKSHQPCVGTTPVLLSVGVVKTNRRKRHFKGKVPRNRSEMQIANNYSIFSGLYFPRGVFFFLQTRWAHLCGGPDLKLHTASHRIFHARVNQSGHTAGASYATCARGGDCRGPGELSQSTPARQTSRTPHEPAPTTHLTITQPSGWVRPPTRDHKRTPHQRGAVTLLASLGPSRTRQFAVMGVAFETEVSFTR